MSSVNKAIIIGNLGRDPEMRTFPDGTASCNLAVATTDKWKDKQTGEQREQTEWHNVTAFERLAEICGQYLTKGSKVYIEGKIKTRKWQDKEGRDRYTTEIHANELQMLDGKSDQPAKPAKAAEKPAAPEFDDDLPF